MQNDAFKNNFHTEIMLEYEKIRATNEASREEIKKQIHTYFPRVKEIDDELSKVALDSCKDILNSTYSIEKIVENMKNRTVALIEEKNEILKKAGFPIDCMNETFNCPDCKDTGWHNGQKCKCYHEKMQKLIFRRSNINADKMHSFDKFRLDLYSDLPSGEYGFSPRENAKAILEIAKNFVKMNDNGSRQLLFYGTTGLGKTFTSECIAREFINKGKDVFYTSAPKLFTIFEDYKFGRNTTDEARRTIEYISNVDLLIIDDLGTEFRTPYVDSILFDLINTAVNENKYMIVSTNLTTDQLESTYSQRITSRILGNFDTVLFFGDDIRLKRK